MKLLDVFLILLLIVGAYTGYKKGLLVEILSFLALIIAIVSAFNLTHLAVTYFSDKKTPEKYLPFICFVAIFILVFACILLLSRFLKTILDFTLLGRFDSWAGALLGTCKMAFGLSVLMWLMHYARIDFPSSYISGTYVYPKILPFAEQVVKVTSYLVPFQDIFTIVKKSLQA